MAIVGKDCLGVMCSYYRRAYFTENITKTKRPACRPIFDLVDEFCVHPDVFSPTKDSFENCEVGKPLQHLKKCPL